MNFLPKMLLWLVMLSTLYTIAYRGIRTIGGVGVSVVLFIIVTVYGFFLLKHYISRDGVVHG